MDVDLRIVKCQSDLLHRVLLVPRALEISRSLSAYRRLEVERLILPSYEEIRLVPPVSQRRLHSDRVSHALEHREHLEFKAGRRELIDVVGTQPPPDVPLLL